MARLRYYFIFLSNCFCILVITSKCLSSPHGLHGNQENPSSLVNVTTMCGKLCPAGFGRPACGGSCTKPNWSNLKHDATRHIQSIGRPRRELCPKLCSQGLGQPLCKCKESTTVDVNWKTVCNNFCSVNVYLDGCPKCEAFRLATVTPPTTDNATRDDDVDWDESCKILCENDEGGLACNCDLIPLDK